MDTPGIESANWSNPEVAHADSANHVDAAEPEPFDTSTVDPSYVIHLIRQLLPNGIQLDAVGSEVLAAGSAIVSKPRALEGAKSGKNGTLQEGYQSVEGGQACKNGIVHGSQVTERLYNGVGDTTHGSVATVLSTSKLKPEEGLCIVNLVQENDNFIEENGNHIKENGELHGKRHNGGGNLLEQKEDNRDHVGNGFAKRFLSGTISASAMLLEAEGKVEEEILNAVEVQHAGRELEKDASQKPSADEDAREEAGCVLWDLAATESHAEFLVEHHILDILLAFLCIQQSDRMREICLGMLGNLACHSGPVNAIIATNSLVETIVQQIFAENIPSLTETCRLLSAGLHSDVTAAWVESIKEDVVLDRIMWITANTLDSQLLEKCTELILVMVDSRKDAAVVLLPSLLRLGLPGLLIDLIAVELTAIHEGTLSQGDLVLDIVLQIAEAISISDDSAAQLASNNQLFSLSCQVICLSARDEIGPSGITATVLIANLLTEESGLVGHLLHDAIFLGRLLALAPCAGEDPGARNALWSIVGRICKCLASTTSEDLLCNPSGMVAVLADGCSLLLDDLDIHQEDDVEEDEDQVLAGHNAAASTSRGLQAKLATVGNIMSIMGVWTIAHHGRSTIDIPLSRSVRNAQLLLRKYVSSNEISPGLAGRDSSGPVQNGDDVPNVHASTAKS